MNGENTPKFNFNLGFTSGKMYKPADFDYFVETHFGDDTNTGITGWVNAFQTLTKVKALGAGIWEDGLYIAVNGVVTNDLECNKAVRIIGHGGGKSGRTIFYRGIGTNYFRMATNIGCYLENIELENYTTADIFINSSYSITNVYLYNCLIKDVKFKVTYAINLYAFNCVFKDCVFTNDYVQYMTIKGNNNTIYDCTSNAGIVITGNNNHVNNALTIVSDTGSNNIKNVDGEYLDPENLNFCFLNTSPLYRTGTYSQLIGKNNHVGFGKQGLSFNAFNPEFNEDEDATYTNAEKQYQENDLFVVTDPGNEKLYILTTTTLLVWVEIVTFTADTSFPLAPDDNDYCWRTDEDKLYQYNLGITTWEEITTGLFFDTALDLGNMMFRTSTLSTGTIESGYIDFGKKEYGNKMGIQNNYLLDNGSLTKLIQETTGLTERNGLDCIVQYGDTTGEVDSCPELLYEYGKLFCVSGTGASRVGNADATFDPDAYEAVGFRYCKLKFRLKSA